MGMENTQPGNDYDVPQAQILSRGSSLPMGANIDYGMDTVLPPDIIVGEAGTQETLAEMNAEQFMPLPGIQDIEAPGELPPIGQSAAEIQAEQDVLHEQIYAALDAKDGQVDLELPSEEEVDIAI